MSFCNPHADYYKRTINYYDSLVNKNYKPRTEEADSLIEILVNQKRFYNENDQINITYYDSDFDKVKFIHHYLNDNKIGEQIEFSKHGSVLGYEYFNWSSELKYYCTYNIVGDLITQKGTPYIMYATDIYESEYLNRNVPMTIDVYVATPPHVKNEIKIGYKRTEEETIYKNQILNINHNWAQYKFMPDGHGKFHVIIQIDSDIGDGYEKTISLDTVQFSIVGPS